jgi:hypothetical protein
LPNDTEAVWELAENRSICIRLEPERARKSVVSPEGRLSGRRGQRDRLRRRRHGRHWP